MTTGFGVCPMCGTPRVAADQGYCAGCGATFTAAPPPAPPASPPQWAMPQAPVVPQPAAPQFGAPPTYQSGADYQPGYQPGYQQGYPPGYQQGYPPGYAPGYQPGYQQGYQPGYPGYPGYAPAAQSNSGLIAAICIIVGAIAAVALIGGLVLMSGSSSGSAGGASPSRIVTPSPTPATKGSIVYMPSTIGCGDAYTLVIRLPASLSGSDRVTVKYDGITKGTQTVSSGFVRQSDGTWLYQDSSGAGSWQCASSGSNSVGTHVETIVDSTDTILAEGTYTLTY